MYFLTLLLILRATEPGRSGMPLEDADASFSLLKTIRDTDARLREEHLRVALLWSDHEYAHIQLTCLSKEGGSSGSKVLQALAPRSVLQCEVQDYEVASVDLTNTTWTGVGTWSDMLSQPPGVRMRFTFATPLVTCNPEHRQADNALPFPDPHRFFTSSLRHWRLLDGPLLPYSGEQMTQVARCVVSEYRLETAERVIAGRPCLGFLGWIEYVCRYHEKTVVVSLNALARLAFFCGSGYLTECGMGVTAVTITN
jgi:CRISPR-associated endoribonuclease Cas6